ncbi:N-acetyltransferase [Salinimicrobium marinum]|uniref:N-acetyltransferase n=1 Tax=Salinimicrobium marinum TaxID=680283 RepID=A0A918VU72_9FLAO|nr:GNAT family protein [Salinimicrobium marinum]GHA23361.1 N-acetyltransferase [Salinimicrobium marinum]
MIEELTTKRFLLRRIKDSDLNNIYKGLSHPEVIKYYGVSYNSLEATREQMRWFRELEQKETGGWRAICSAGDETFLGATGFNNLSKEHKKTELGFWILPEFWGRGIIQELLPVICNYAFENLHLHRIEAFVESENVNSAKALKNQGFQHEGTMVDSEVKNGKFISVELFAKLKSK